MSEVDSELVSRLVTRRKQDGRCVYDPAAKAELVRACIAPGVSVARIAMQCGINANLLRSWIGKKQGADKPVMQPAPAAAFIPLQIEAVRAAPLRGQMHKATTLSPATPSMALRLQVRLPNGVEFDLGEAGLDELSAIMRTLSSLPCSASTKR